MKILIAYASRMGSNAEIAEAIAQQLREAGQLVQTSPCSPAPDPWGYDAVIVGSALYLGRWDKTAVRYLRRHSASLAARPTWLFQSGPCGEGADVEQVDTPRAVRRLVAQIGISPPVTFGGRLDHTLANSRLSRWMTIGAYAGDFRDWNQIRSWTTHFLAEVLRGEQTVRTAAL